MARRGSVSVRYMDDWVVLAPTRWKLRMAIRAVNQVMARLWVREHPDNTIIHRAGVRFLRLSVFGDRPSSGTADRRAVRGMAVPA